LRAQLQIQSLLTGQLHVEINFRPETPIKLMGGGAEEYPEIPSIPSPKEQLENTLVEFVAMARKVPIQQTVEALLNTILQMEKLMRSPEVASSLTTIDHTLKDLRHLVRDLDAKLDPLAKGLDGSLQESRKVLANINKNVGPVLLSTQEAMKATTGAMTQAEATLLTMDRATGQNTNLDLALKDLGTAAKSLRVLADYLERHPDALLYGKSPNGE
jgi:paraquat-inducible protein B